MAECCLLDTILWGEAGADGSYWGAWSISKSEEMASSMKTVLPLQKGEITKDKNHLQIKQGRAAGKYILESAGGCRFMNSAGKLVTLCHFYLPPSPWSSEALVCGALRPGVTTGWGAWRWGKPPGAMRLPRQLGPIQSQIRKRRWATGSKWIR